MKHAARWLDERLPRERDRGGDLQGGAARGPQGRPRARAAAVHVLRLPLGLEAAPRRLLAGAAAPLPGDGRAAHRGAQEAARRAADQGARRDARDALRAPVRRAPGREGAKGVGIALCDGPRDGRRA